MWMMSVKWCKNVVMAEAMGLAAQATLPAPASLPAPLDAAWKAALPGQARLGVGEDAHHAGVVADLFAQALKPVGALPVLVVSPWQACLRRQATEGEGLLDIRLHPIQQLWVLALPFCDPGSASPAPLPARRCARRGDPPSRPPSRSCQRAAPPRHAPRHCIVRAAPPHGKSCTNASCGRGAPRTHCIITRRPAPMAVCALRARWATHASPLPRVVTLCSLVTPCLRGAP